MIMIMMVMIKFGHLCITLDSEDKVLPRPSPHVDVRRRLLVKVSGIHDRPADRDHEDDFEQMIRMGIPVTLYSGVTMSVIIASLIISLEDCLQNVLVRFLTMLLHVSSSL